MKGNIKSERKHKQCGKICEIIHGKQTLFSLQKVSIYYYNATTKLGGEGGNISFYFDHEVL